MVRSSVPIIKATKLLSFLWVGVGGGGSNR